MINEIFNLCSKPQAACDNIESQILNGELFSNEIDLGDALIQIDTDEDDSLRDLFTKHWIIHFYPQNLVETSLVRDELLELADRAKERSAPSHLIYTLADEYLRSFNELLEYSTKFGYDAIPSYMVVYEVINEVMHLQNVLTVKPCTVLDFLESKKITIV